MIMFACFSWRYPGRLALFKGEGRVRDDFKPAAVVFTSTPHLHPLPFVRGEANPDRWHATRPRRGEQALVAPH